MNKGLAPATILLALMLLAAIAIIIYFCRAILVKVHLMRYANKG